MNQFYKIILFCSLFLVEQTYLSPAQAAQNRHAAVAKRAKIAKVSKTRAQKILYGERIAPGNGIRGAHSPRVLTHPDFATELLHVNPDGTKVVRLTKQYSDGKSSKLKKSTLFPDHWSDKKILTATLAVGRNPKLGTQATNGATVHRGIINGIEIEVIKEGHNVTASYPTGGNSPLPSGFN